MILAIDPGTQRSAYCWIAPDTLRPVSFHIEPNRAIRHIIRNEIDRDDQLAIEMIASYGMPVGAEVFETCLWIGRFIEAAADETEAQLVTRLVIKNHHCHSAKANDATVRKALIDRFAPNTSNHGKGTKGQPGWFYRFSADVWSAYALAVYIADQEALAA